MVEQKIIPEFKKLHDFFVNEYMPACRETHGLSSLPDGKARYEHLVRYYTSCLLYTSYMFSGDVVSYNYQTSKFDKWHQQYPGLIFISSETKACREEQLKDYNNYDFLTNSWFDLHAYACGQFIWTGIDYYGESKGWPHRGNMSGLINSCGFRKPHSYFTESMYSEKPMVALTVHDDSIANLLNNYCLLYTSRCV